MAVPDQHAVLRYFIYEVAHADQDNEHHHDAYPSFATPGRQPPCVANVISHAAPPDGPKDGGGHQGESNQQANDEEGEKYSTSNRYHLALHKKSALGQWVAAAVVQMEQRMIAAVTERLQTGYRRLQMVTDCEL
jgi:hypothetical protein